MALLMDTKITYPTLIIYEFLRYMLDQNVSVNFYMFHGGTNFGFTAGANDGGPGKYQPDLTSYDYDAPMDEAGKMSNMKCSKRKISPSLH